MRKKKVHLSLPYNGQNDQKSAHLRKEITLNQELLTAYQVAKTNLQGRKYFKNVQKKSKPNSKKVPRDLHCFLVGEKAENLVKGEMKAEGGIY